MTAPLTPAEAWCWVALLLGHEATALEHAWPPSDEAYARAARLRDEADAAHARARGLDGDAGLWRRAVEKWETPGPDDPRDKCVHYGEEV
jgi:hypothetical protein